MSPTQDLESLWMSLEDTGWNRVPKRTIPQLLEEANMGKDWITSRAKLELPNMLLKMLESLNMLLTMPESPAGEDMKVFLAVPTHLNSLLSYLSCLMKLVVFCLRTSDEMLSFGLHTLEFSVGRLNPGVMYSMASVMSKVVLALLSHLRPVPYPWGMKALQILGKLGGSNRRFLKERVIFACKDIPEHGLCFDLMFGPSTSFLVPLDKFTNVCVAAVIQRNHGMNIYYRKQALKLLREIKLLEEANMGKDWLTSRAKLELPNMLLKMLESLNMLLTMLESPAGEDMKVFLAVPMHLNFLLSYLSCLMKLVVFCLRTSDEMLSFGLHTLEFSVGRLNPGVMYSMASVMSKVVLALLSHLRPVPYPWGMKALQILGKLGGSNRRFLKERVIFACKDIPEHGLCFDLMFGPSTSFLVPLDKFTNIVMAPRDIIDVLSNLLLVLKNQDSELVLLQLSCTFGAVTKTLANFKRFLQPHQIVVGCFAGCIYELLQSDLIPVLLPCLNIFLPMLESPTGEDMKALLLENFLAVPTHLSYLFSYLSCLMKLVVYCLRTSDEILSFGLHTLEFSVDSLNPDVMYSMASVMSKVVLALLSHLRPVPYPWGMKALQILGKLGGSNRRFLKERVIFACKDIPEHGLCFDLMFGPSTSFLVPLDKFTNVCVAAVIQRNHGMNIYYRKQALKLLREIKLLEEANMGKNWITSRAKLELPNMLLKMLESLNMLLTMPESPAGEDMKVFLAVPTHLNSLLSYLSCLMKLVVFCLRTSDEMLSFGLHTLEFSVDRLNPGVMYSMASVMSKVVLALLSHLRPVPYPWGMKALQILGKLGGSNRRFLKERVIFACKDIPEHGLCFDLMFGPSTSFLVPLDKFTNVCVAAVIQRNHGMNIYYRKQALKLLREIKLLEEANMGKDWITLRAKLELPVEDFVEHSKEVNDCNNFIKTLVMGMKTINRTVLLLLSLSSPCSAAAASINPEPLPQWTSYWLLFVLFIVFGYLVRLLMVVKTDKSGPISPPEPAEVSSPEPAGISPPKPDETSLPVHNVIPLPKFIGELKEIMKSLHHDAIRDKGRGRYVKTHNTSSKLFISKKKVAYEPSDIQVFEGVYQSQREVAVKCLPLSNVNVPRIFNEITQLIKSDGHANVLRFYGYENDDNIMYLCVEPWGCSLTELVRWSTGKGKEQVIYKIECLLKHVKVVDRISPTVQNLIRDVVKGLVHLHRLGIVLRNLHPDNIFILLNDTKTETPLIAKISNLGMSESLSTDLSSISHPKSGYGMLWKSPEQLSMMDETRAVDMFSLGCVIFYTLTGGSHPFGSVKKRAENILNNSPDIFRVEKFPEAHNLISSLLKQQSSRPSAIEVLNHPMFWDYNTRLCFLRDTSDKVEPCDPNDQPMLDALKNITTTVIGGLQWDKKLDKCFIDYINGSNGQQARNYNVWSLRNLLRLIRNCLNHFRDLPADVLVLVGGNQEGLDRYFSLKFPKLLMMVYVIMSTHCKGDPELKKYF